MTTNIHTGSTVVVSRTARHLGWFAFGNLIAFLIPYVGVSVLDSQHDVFYLSYFALTLALLAAYARTEQVDVRDLFARTGLERCDRSGYRCRTLAEPDRQ